MNVANPGNGADGAFRSDDDPALIDERLVEPATEHLHCEKAVRRNATDHSAKLVHVGVDHDARSGCTLRRDDGAEPVEADGGSEGLDGIDHDFADRLFKAGGSGCVGESAKRSTVRSWADRLPASARRKKDFIVLYIYTRKDTA